MHVLLDSHCLIWALDDPARLSPAAAAILQDPINVLMLSAASVWELAIKFGKGRLPLSMPYRAWMDRAFADLGLILLPITLDHAEHQVRLPFHHRDPFDRLLASQALVENLALVSGDTLFDAYGVTRIWN